MHESGVCGVRNIASYQVCNQSTKEKGKRYGRGLSTTTCVPSLLKSSKNHAMLLGFPRQTSVEQFHDRNLYSNPQNGKVLHIPFSESQKA